MREKAYRIRKTEAGKFYVEVGERKSILRRLFSSGYYDWHALGPRVHPMKPAPELRRSKRHKLMGAARFAILFDSKREASEAAREWWHGEKMEEQDPVVFSSVEDPERLSLPGRPEQPPFPPRNKVPRSPSGGTGESPGKETKEKKPLFYRHGYFVPAYYVWSGSGGKNRRFSTLREAQEKGEEINYRNHGHATHVLELGSGDYLVQSWYQMGLGENGSFFGSEEEAIREAKSRGAASALHVTGEHESRVPRRTTPREEDAVRLTEDIDDFPKGTVGYVIGQEGKTYTVEISCRGGMDTAGVIEAQASQIEINGALPRQDRD